MKPIAGRRPSIVMTGTFVLMCGVLAVPASAQRAKDGQDPLDKLVFAKPELRVSRTLTDAERLPEGVWNRDAIGRFRADNGSAWRVLVDERTGRVSLLDGGAIPFIPGPANKLQWRELGADCESPSCLPLARLESLAREFLERHQQVIKVNPAELVLDPLGSVPVGNSIYHLRFQWTHGKLPVEGASVFFTVNNGNLIQLGVQSIGDIELSPSPTISAEQAWKTLWAYVGGRTERDEMLSHGALAIMPITPKGLDPDALKLPFGKAISYVLVHKLAFRRAGVLGTWEALVDAHTGDLLRFRDSNVYGQVKGGVYKTDVPQTEVSTAFPFADYGSGYADAAGAFPGTTGTSTMAGPTSGAPGGVAISDVCGAISRSASGTGLIDFGTSAGTDCTSPGFGGAGNTHAARTQYWNVTAIKMKANSYLPSNTWLQGQLTDNVNINQHCNAYWSSWSQDVNFFESGNYTPPGSSTTYTCANTGELPGVSLHEWGHGMDEHDGSGVGTDNVPLEARADWTALLQTHQSCTGSGFYQNIAPLPSYGTNCDGTGNACTACTGVRDADYAQHATPTPWTPQNKGTVWGTAHCSGGSYFGPCGWEDHCESGVATQALWDFVNRDLVAAPTSLDSVSAWQLADRLFYSGMPSSTDMYTCTGGATKVSDGCSAGSLYAVMRSIDDDGDGTANGTPHAAAIFAALNRHGIACGTASDPGNQNHTSCPALTTPTLTATASSHQITLSWTSAGAAATRYFVLRNETGCGAGFARIATVTAPTLTYTDSMVAHGQTYYYRIQAATASDSCVSGMSNCATASASLAADKDLYVSDWNSSSTLYDNGTEPSAGPNWAYSGDVWNRSSNSAGTPNANNWYPTDAVQAGLGALGNNYAFARVRRNASGSAASVTAHFFISPFGTGSNFADAGAAADPILSFAAGDVEQVSSGYLWHQDATASTHACLAVQIASTDDPYKSPSLLGRTPGPDDYLVSDDNNKAQRNLGVSNNTFHFAGIAYALIHNPALFPRDVVLRFDSPAASRLRGTKIEVVGGRTMDFRAGGTLTLEHMQPGENRWIAIRHAVPQGVPAPIHVVELGNGGAMSGFTVLAQPVQLSLAIRDNLRNHVHVFNRLAAVLGETTNAAGAQAAGELLKRKLVTASQYSAFLTQQKEAMASTVGSLVGKEPTANAFGGLAKDAIAEAIARNESERAASEHALLLNRLDALITMLQKAKGDPADILQMVRWQEALYRSRPALRQLTCAARVVQLSEAFIEDYGRDGNKRYDALLAELAQCFHDTAHAFGSDGKAIEDAATAVGNGMRSLATLEKAHREYLLAVQAAAGPIRD